MAQAHKVTVLPYMGINTADRTSALVERAVEAERYEAEKCEELEDPLTILERKISAIAKLLNCDEARAEDILFDRIGNGNVMKAKRQPLSLLKS